jgi:RHS repeat-associated protein
MVDSSGAIRARYDYAPWGERAKVSGDLDCDFGFTGHYQHAPSGLTVAPLRFYSAPLGRWLRRDPLGEAGGLNLYNYVSNDPVSGFDSLGLDPNPLIVLYNGADRSAAGLANGNNFQSAANSIPHYYAINISNEYWDMQYRWALAGLGNHVVDLMLIDHGAAGEQFFNGHHIDSASDPIWQTLLGTGQVENLWLMGCFTAYHGAGLMYGIRDKYGPDVWASEGQWHFDLQDIAQKAFQATSPTDPLRPYWPLGSGGNPYTNQGDLRHTGHLHYGPPAPRQ